jgi:exopolyphosphatase / guanosine-5'-triphosphate,3'-diphosphate pyrophosphatase
MTIVPRWEWRAFGDDLGGPGNAFAALAPDRVGAGRDVYVLSRRSDASVKVRDALLDVKRLLAVAGDGLERWVPVLKAPFPLSAANVAMVLAELGTPAPDLDRDAYTLDELLEEIVRPSADLRVAEVSKHRAHYTAGGCMAELSEMRTVEGSTTTVAVESEDDERVRAAVHALGLAGRPVVCVARGLKTLVGFGAHRYAVIDVGTNSVKFHVGERTADGTWRAVVDRAEVTRLGEGLDATGRLGAAAIDRTAAAVDGMGAEARREGAEAIAAVGTAALRIAPNAAALIEAVRARCGVQVEVIGAAEETRLAYLAARAGLPAASGSIVVFDTGGGSSQFTFGVGDRVEEQFSVDVGAARFTERFGLDGAVSRDVLDAALAAIAAELGALAGRPAPDGVVGMGGAVTNLTAVRHGLTTYDPDVVQGTVLERAEIERQIELYRTRDAAGRREIAGLQANRAEVILAGACIVRTVLGLLGRDALTVSDRGLRHGLLVERFSGPPETAATAAAAAVASAAAG